jgi:hypothetical protein
MCDLSTLALHVSKRSDTSQLLSEALLKLRRGERVWTLMKKANGREARRYCEGVDRENEDSEGATQNI